MTKESILALSLITQVKVNTKLTEEANLPSYFHFQNWAGHSFAEFSSSLLVKCLKLTLPIKLCVSSECVGPSSGGSWHRDLETSSCILKPVYAGGGFMLLWFGTDILPHSFPTKLFWGAWILSLSSSITSLQLFVKLCQSCLYTAAQSGHFVLSPLWVIYKIVPLQPVVIALR